MIKYRFAFNMKVALCCDDLPEVLDFSHPYGQPTYSVTTEIKCAQCGEHIHSEFAIQGALEIWNRRKEKCQ